MFCYYIMVFLHINPASPDTNLLNSYIGDGKQIFVLFYLDGCGPCQATRPEWDKMQHSLPHLIQDNDVVVADVDQSLLDSITGNLGEINSFPTIMYLTDNGDIKENYERERTEQAFKDWITSKTKSKSKSKSKTKKSTKHSRRHTGGSKLKSKRKCKSKSKSYSKSKRRRHHTKQRSRRH